jgi:hypothetical protein
MSSCHTTLSVFYGEPLMNYTGAHKNVFAAGR